MQWLARQTARVTHEIAEAYKRYAFEEADHASRFAELLGEVLGDTKSNLEARIAAEKVLARISSALPSLPRSRF